MSIKRDRLNLSEESQDWADEDIEAYIPVFDAVNFDALTALAAELRRREDDGPGHVCVVDYNILGSYSIVTVLRFEDGVKWAAKIPRYAISPTFRRLQSGGL